MKQMNISLIQGYLAGNIFIAVKADYREMAA